METPNISIEQRAAGYAAWLRGETVQVWNYGRDSWVDIPSIEYSAAVSFSRETLFRVKPQPKLRPWRMSELPSMGSWWIRRKSWTPNAKSLVIGITNDGFLSFWSANVVSGKKIDDLEGYEYSINNGASWHECGVLE